MNRVINVGINLCVSFMLYCSFDIAAASSNYSISGDLKKWHKVQITFDGPDTSETDEYNPFLNYRLVVSFKHEGTNQKVDIPGFYAADGNAGESSAVSGNKWRVNFRPDKLGEWTWQASFRKGNFVAVSQKEKTGVSAEFMDGLSGKLVITRSDKKAPDFRAKGRLKYIGKPYLQFSETGEYFIKAGPDSPENLLSYQDFDGEFKIDGTKDHLVKTWEAHLSDFENGDPIWQNGKGKGLIGALNYISAKGMNSISFLTLNIKGDDENVYPYIDDSTFDRFDVSKLDQWERVFEHAQNKGLFLHFKTQEVENQGLLDNGGVGLERKLYYRELIARFGHHLALNWNLGEENGEWYANHNTPPQSTDQRIAMARYFYENDPYHHHIVIHNGNFFDDLQGIDSHYTGASLQTNREDFSSIHSQVKKIRSWPNANGKQFAVSVDEPGDAQFALVPQNINSDYSNARINGLWGALTAGAWGTEWYFGYKHPHSDLNAEDWRSRDIFWDQAHHAIRFFELINVDFHEGTNHDELVMGGWALAKPTVFYIIHARSPAKGLKLKLEGGKANYRIQWFDPRNGGVLQEGSISSVKQTEPYTFNWVKHTVDLGKPPTDPEEDWVVLVTKI